MTKMLEVKQKTKLIFKAKQDKDIFSERSEAQIFGIDER